MDISNSSVKIPKHLKDSPKFYSGVEKLLIAVDCIIFGFDKTNLKLLLFKRKVQPFKDNWTLIGSFVRKSENLEQAAKRILYEATGLSEVLLKQLFCYGRTDRDPGDRVISIAYYALIPLIEDNECTTGEHEAQWFEVDNAPSVILDHNEMVFSARKKLCENTKYEPIGFELLPEKFTLPQLRLLYEALFQRKLDRRNFSKKILSMDILEKLDEKDKSTSTKGANLYRFDELKYKDKLENGFYFKI